MADIEAPTTEHVRSDYAAWHGASGEVKFDRWLDAVKAEAAATALEETPENVDKMARILWETTWAGLDAKMRTVKADFDSGVVWSAVVVKDEWRDQARAVLAAMRGTTPQDAAKGTDA